MLKSDEINRYEYIIEIANIETYKQLFNSIFGDILDWIVAYMSEDIYMYTKDSISEFVFSLSDSDFSKLKHAVNDRISKERYGATTIEEFAIKNNKQIKCPSCGSSKIHKDGISKTKDSHQKFECNECGHRFTLMSKSIFNSMKISFNQLTLYITLMTFNVPLTMCEELCDISHPTAMLWRKKIFSTINNYQENIILKDTIWIDEFYIYDYSILHEDGYKQKRGLSKDQLCLVAAIDCYKNIVIRICGHGKPSSKRIKKTLASHIKSGSCIYHDGENSHNELIKDLDCESRVFIANPKNPEYIKNMALINNLCSWIRRYLFRFIGMDINNLESYLNWFVYLFRVKSNNEKWPKIERILRHLVLSDAQFTRK